MNLEFIFKKVSSIFKHIKKILLILLVIELGLRVCYALIGLIDERFPPKERINQNVISPEISFEPFVIWGLSPVSSLRYNVNEKGQRRTWNPEFKANQKYKLIYMFGSSTLLGVAGADEETIPSELSKILNQQGYPSFVVNQAVGGYGFNQELIKLIQLLRAGERPQIVIFYDGIGDVSAAYQSKRAKTVYKQDEIAELFKKNLFSRKSSDLFIALLSRLKIVKLCKEIFFHNAQPALVTKVDKTVETSAREKLEDDLLEDYTRSHQLLEGLAKLYGFKFYSFWEPISLNEKFLFPEERAVNTSLDDPGLIALHKDLSIKVRRSHLSNFAYIGDALESRSRQVYMDTTHLNLYGHHLMALRIFQELKKAAIFSEN
jgi:lysophospholipase L1-like esterase